MDPQTPLDRIKAAIAECPHPRGQNWQPVMVPVLTPTGEVTHKKGYRNPTIALLSDDIAAVCDSIPPAQRTKIVIDLRAGQRPHLKRTPPAEVAIHVDDAHHLVELAEAAAAAAAVAADKRVAS